MKNHLSPPPQDPNENTTTPISKLNTKDLAGTITNQIGTGSNAKDSFIWLTITWSFYVASGITALLFIKAFFICVNSDNLINEIKSIWALFVPIITLALGYAFGKGQ